MIWAFKKCLVDISANAVRQFQVRQCGKKDEAQYLEEDFRENPFQHISFLYYLKIDFVKKIDVSSHFIESFIKSFLHRVGNFLKNF